MRFPGTCSGKRKRKRSSLRRSLEYLGVSRLRRRRLLAFLSRHGFKTTFEALLHETNSFFSVAHLQRLARLGQWGEAIGYVYRFVPNIDLLGEEGNLFFSFISLHEVIHSIATGEPGGAVLAELYEHELLKKHPNPNPDLPNVKLIRMLADLCRSHQLRASVNWLLVRYKAAEIAKDLIARTPEFSDLVRLPNCPDKPHNILPIRSCSHSRYHMKKIAPIPAAHLAKFYLQKKRHSCMCSALSSLLSLSRCEGSSAVSGLSGGATALLAKFIDISVRAGMSQAVQDEHPVEDSCNEAILPKCKRESSASCNLSMMEVSSAKRKQVRHPLDYPCVSRLRHRRLLAFLRWRYGSTFKAFVHETGVFFSIEHLERLVFLGQWDDAIKYVSRFVPSLDKLGSEGTVFSNFLQVQKALHSIAAGEPYGTLMAMQYERNLKKYPNSDPGTVKLTRVLLTMLRCENLRTSIDWSCMRFKAAEIVKDLITKTPKFNDLLRLPNCRDKPHTILPIGSCSHQRHHMKERGRTPSSDIANFYLQKKRSLPSSSHCEGNSVVSGLSCEESTWLADITVESLLAGLGRVVQQGHSFKGSCNEGLKHTMITGYTGGEVSFPRNNPKKRPLTTVCQVLNPKRQHLSGEFGQGNAGVVHPGRTMYQQ
ncbi:uncharacterized protein [Lolium perenne]|uniref:uncharacterized protein n=1 Tax=Lolium perenne TaxID=4522 RepID=UPI003A9A6417